MALFLRRQQRAPARVDGRPPNAALLRRERRSLLEARESLLRDLGGLMVEMYRRREYRDDVLAAGCADVVAVDERVAEIERLLGTRSGPCPTCGAATVRGSRFCSNCGRDLAAGGTASGER